MEPVILNIHWYDPGLYCILISLHKWSELDFRHDLLGVRFPAYFTLIVTQVSSKSLDHNSYNIEILRRWHHSILISVDRISWMDRFLCTSVSKVLNKQAFSSTKFIAAQLRTSRELVRRTLIEVWGMQRFSWWWIYHKSTAVRKPQRVVRSQQLLKSWESTLRTGLSILSPLTKVGRIDPTIVHRNRVYPAVWCQLDRFITLTRKS
jgi:hypothetical protein